MGKPGSSRVRDTFKMCAIVLVTAVLVALAVPTAVGAAGSLVKIEDGDSQNRAQVDNGKVRVGDGVGNPNSLTVNGTVLARPQWPGQFVHANRVAGGSSGCVQVIAPPAGKALVITNVVFTINDNPSPGPGDWAALWVGAPGSCASLITHTTPDGTGAEPISLEPGITIPDGQALNMNVSGDVVVYAAAVGYQLAASAVAASNVDPTSGEGPALPQP